MNWVQERCTDKAWRSPTRFAEVKASSSAVLYERNFISAYSVGSNGGPQRASSTSTKYLEGTLGLNTGLSLRTSFRKRVREEGKTQRTTTASEPVEERASPLPVSPLHGGTVRWRMCRLGQLAQQQRRQRSPGMDRGHTSWKSFSCRKKPHLWGQGRTEELTFACLIWRHENQRKQTKSTRG